MSRIVPQAFATLLCLAGAGPRGPAASAQGFPTEFKNLQVFDRKIAPRELKKKMDGFTEELGVKCAFCHNEENYASDELKHKLDARKMVQLVQFMRANRSKYFKANVKDEDLSCGGCHRGKSEPDPFVP
jgi:photosynthetic reaction center cytochrome c subunit